MNEAVRCAYCGDVIGVYEPLVVVDGFGTRLTSRAAEPQLAGDAGQHYHRTCHNGLYERGEAADAHS